jgi:hypothetical protein
MSSHYNNNTHFFFNIMIWLGISLGISLTISFLLPFPTSLVVIIAVFVLLNFYMRRRLMQRTRTKARGRFSTDSSSFTAKESSSLKYSCMNCGMQHKCGSGFLSSYDLEAPICGKCLQKAKSLDSTVDYYKICTRCGKNSLIYGKKQCHSCYFGFEKNKEVL